MGRPTILTDDIASRIFSRLSDGESLRSICQSPDLPASSTVRKWVIDNPDFSAKYARAREVGTDELFESLLEVVEETKADPTLHQWARLKVDTLKWYLSKVAPRRFSERQLIDDVSDPKPTVVNVNLVESVDGKPSE